MRFEGIATVVVVVLVLSVASVSADEGLTRESVSADAVVAQDGMANETTTEEMMGEETTGGMMDDGTTDEMMNEGTTEEMMGDETTDEERPGQGGAGAFTPEFALVAVGVVLLGGVLYLRRN